MFSLDKNFVREQNKLIEQLIEELLDKTVAFRMKEKLFQEKEDSFVVLEKNLCEIARILEEHFLKEHFLGEKGKNLLLQLSKERKDLKEEIHNWEKELKQKNQNSPQTEDSLKEETKAKTENTQKSDPDDPLTKPLTKEEETPVQESSTKDSTPTTENTVQNKIVKDFGSILLVEED